MDVWPDNSPDSLEDLCVDFCVRHPHTFSTLHPGTGHLCFLEGVSLPKAICDKIFNHYVDSVDDTNCVADGFVNVFRDTDSTQLSQVNLAHSGVSDHGLELLSSQPVVDLDVTECSKLTIASLPSINRIANTLRSLRLENTPALFDWSDTCDMSEYTNRDNSKCSQNSKGNSLSCPHLRRLSLRAFNMDEESSEEGILSFDLWKVILAAPCLTHLDLAMCTVSPGSMNSFKGLPSLVSLSLADVDIKEIGNTMDYLSQLHQLKHLDLSQGRSELTPIMYPAPEEHLQKLVSGLPNLTSLDLSATNLAGFELSDTPTSRPEKRRGGTTQDSSSSKERTCCIPGLEGRHLNFLGLLGCAYDACFRSNIPADQVSGEHNEDQVLLSLQMYQDRPSLLTKSLNNLFPLFRISTVTRQCAALEAILAGMKRHPSDRHVQISGSASLFYIAKGEKKDFITQKQKRRIVDLLLKAMESFPYEQTMMRNGCLTLCHFNIPHDVIYCYEKLVHILLQMLKREHQDEFIHRIGIFLLNCLACQVEGREKEMVGSLGAIETMLNIIRRKLVSGECDEVLEVAWSTMWNVTDETAPNCERFMDLGGMQLFLQCLEKFDNRAELLRNMMGLMGNIAEVKELRCRLMVPEYVQVFSDLLDSTSDGIEVSYNAAGVLAHLASDGPAVWTIPRPERPRVLHRMVGAINRWDICSKRNINYRSFQPILRLLTIFETPEVQHWAVWALCNLTGFCPDKYCSLLEKENGVPLLEALAADPRPYRTIQRLAQHVLRQMKLRRSWTELEDMEDSPVSSDVEEREGEGEGEDQAAVGRGGEAAEGMAEDPNDLENEEGDHREKCKQRLDRNFEYIRFIDSDEDDDDIRL